MSMTNRDAPHTNNVSERHLRPSVIFCKVTNGFRCEWGAETYAASRSVVSTTKANGASVLETVRFVLLSQTTRGDSASSGVSNYFWINGKITRGILIQNTKSCMLSYYRPIRVHIGPADGFFLTVYC